MGVPKKRHSKSKVGRRRMHLFLEKPDLVSCPKCGHLVLPHRVCPFCGYYREKQVVDVLTKIGKKERKKREKEVKEKESEKKSAPVSL